MVMMVTRHTGTLRLIRTFPGDAIEKGETKRYGKTRTTAPASPKAWFSLGFPGGKSKKQAFCVEKIRESWPGHRGPRIPGTHNHRCENHFWRQNSGSVSKSAPKPSDREAEREAPEEAP